MGVVWVGFFAFLPTGTMLLIIGVLLNLFVGLTLGSFINQKKVDGKKVFYAGLGSAIILQLIICERSLE